MVRKYAVIDLETTGPKYEGGIESSNLAVL